MRRREQIGSPREDLKASSSCPSAANKQETATFLAAGGESHSQGVRDGRGREDVSSSSSSSSNAKLKPDRLDLPGEEDHPTPPVTPAVWDSPASPAHLR
ncbi:unnamed protein product, partial [Pylaiella littoralis]